MSKKFTRIVCIILAALMLVGFITMIASSRAQAVTQAERMLLRRISSMRNSFTLTPIFWA